MIEQRYMNIKNAIIKSAEISTGDRGLLDCWLQLDYGGNCQGFGGFSLYLPQSWKHHKLMSVAGHHIFRIMEVAGVDKWSDLPGKTIRVAGTDDRITSIGHIVKDDWYTPSEDFQKARKEGGLES